MTAAAVTVTAQRAIDRLDRWITANGWAGYDPYDVKGTPFFLYLLKADAGIPLKIIRRPFLYAEMYLPMTMRKVMRIAPRVNAKGMALLAKAYLQLFQVTGRHDYRARALECLTWLDSHRSPGFDEPCWGYPFDWQSGVFTPAGTPSSVVCSAVADAYWTAWTVLGETRYRDVCEGICRFFLAHLRRDEMPDGTVCFSYTPLDDFHVHNANLLVAEQLVRVGRAVGRPEWDTMGLRAGGYALAEQNADGSLYYWGRVQNHFNPDRVDHYHSGFEIRALHSIALQTGRADYRTAADRYYRFYLDRLVEPRGAGVAPRMTPQSLYPVNVHACAEALLLNATLAPTHPDAQALVAPLLAWILPTMQNADGSFSYMITRLLGRELRQSIPYMRWGQAWMLLALSQCLLAAAPAADTGDTR